MSNWLANTALLIIFFHGISESVRELERMAYLHEGINYLERRNQMTRRARETMALQAVRNLYPTPLMGQCISCKELGDSYRRMGRTMYAQHFCGCVRDFSRICSACAIKWAEVSPLKCLVCGQPWRNMQIELICRKMNLQEYEQRVGQAIMLFASFPVKFFCSILLVLMVLVMGDWTLQTKRWHRINKRNANKTILQWNCIQKGLNCVEKGVIVVNSLSQRTNSLWKRNSLFRCGRESAASDSLYNWVNSCALWQ